MSKLQELINELCPDGVEYKYIDNLFYISRGIVISKQYIASHEGVFPVYSSQTENDGELGRINEYKFDGEYITWTTDGANAGTVFYRNGKFNVTNVCGVLESKTNIINTKFVYYVLSIEAGKYVNKGMGNAKLMSNVMAKIKVPVPPLQVQEEIVRILDKMTGYVTELKAELKARKMQYEYYKSLLLSAGEKVRLKEVAEYSKGRILASELNASSYVGVDNLLQNKMGKTDAIYIPLEGKCTKFLPNDILIGNIRPYLKKIWFSNIKGGTNGDVLAIHITSNRIEPRYLYYVLSSDDFFHYDNSNSKGAKMPRGNKDLVMEYSFNLPSVLGQRKIINMMDKFELLSNNLTSGIPAEIEARQKQYEYYRDKLLTFKELKHDTI